MDQNMNTGAQMPQEKTPTGPIISIIVIVFVLAFGAYYFMKQLPAKDDASYMAPTAEEMQADPTISALSTQGTSSSVADIQNDVSATDLSGLDAGLSDITF